jgi:hypothetical protein
MKFLHLGAAASCCLLVNCASIFGKSTWPVTLNSNPSGAKVVVKDHNDQIVHQGVTPSTVTLSSSAGYFRPAHYSLEFSKKGYPTQTIPLSASMSGWYMGNILIGGLMGMLVIDPATGAMWKLEEPMAANLTPLATLDNGNGRKVQVIDRSTLPAAMQKNLIALQ